MLTDKHGEPVFPPGAFWRFIAFIVSISAVPLIMWYMAEPSKSDLVMPYEIREAAADCILNDTPKSCEIYEKAKPLYPIRNP